MTDTFTVDTSFLSKIAPASGLFFPNGFINPMMRGLDLNHYILTGDGIGTAVLCAETGSITDITLTRIRTDLADLGVANPNDYGSIPTLWAAPETPYFYVIVFRADGADYYFAAVLYKIISDGSLSCVGGLNYHTHNVGFGGPGAPQQMYASKVIGSTLYILGLVHTNIVGTKPAVFQLPLSETFTQDLSAGAWEAYYKYTPLADTFFDYIGANRSGQAVASLVDLNDGRVGILVYIGQAEYDYISAHPGHNAQWTAMTGPGVWWGLTTDLGITNVTAQFGITDIKTHRDGMASSNYYDDYVSPCSFVFDGTSYILFLRSYTLPADLEPIGTYVRLRLYSWNGSSAVSVLDTSTATFDPVTDCGVTAGDRSNSYPEFVHTGYDPTTNRVYYVWYGRAGDLNFNYVFGGLLDLTHTETDWFVTFSDFHDPSFTDWRSPDPLGVGADMSSELTTFYMSGDDTMLWMQSPYILVYIQNTERAPAGLQMQAQWDWSDAEGAHKWSRVAEVYREAELSKVAVSKNRVRGKGRALRLFFESGPSKDFNILSWGIDMDKNARY